ncbi:hypothetical protein GCM10023215_40960 [Pseudonocardia yuanmonensis]|uniref:Uncharacterized protein n=1 Tax=Pseudonocardia yuanmonensis TaxID=1095914 RepID=A0ABP8X353_9PSEU
MAASPLPRWIVPLLVLSDLVVLGVLYAVLGRPGLLFGVPLLVGTVIALLVLRLVTAPHRRLLADLRAGAVGPLVPSGAAGATRPGPYRHGSSGADDPLWWWPADGPASGDDSCPDRDHRPGAEHSCGGSWTSDSGPGRSESGGSEPGWSGSGAASGWSGSDTSSSSSSDSSSSSSSDSGSSSSSSSD